MCNVIVLLGFFWCFTSPLAATVHQLPSCGLASLSPLWFMDLNHPNKLELPTARAFKSGINLHMANAAVMAATTPTDFKKVRDFFGKVPHMVMIEKSDKQSKKILEQHGYITKLWSSPLMEFEFTKIPHHLSFPEEITVTQVRNQDIANVWTRLSVAGYEKSMQSTPLGQFFSYLKSVDAHDNIFFYLAFFKGQPAATVIMTHNGDQLGIHLLSTIPSMRNKKIAQALLWHGVSRAMQHGCVRAWGSSAPAAKAWYEKLGCTQKGTGVKETYLSPF